MGNPFSRVKKTDHHAGQTDRDRYLKPCDLFAKQEFYDWELLVGEKSIEIASNCTNELVTWVGDKKRLVQLIKVIKKGYLNLRPSNSDEKRIIDKALKHFEEAEVNEDPDPIIRAYTSDKNFTDLLNKDLSRIVWHDVCRECSKFSCDTLYIAEDGLKAIASIILYNPKLEVFEGVVYCGFALSTDLSHLQQGSCILALTFVSTSKDRAIAEMFSESAPAYCKVLIICTFEIKNLQGKRRAWDLHKSVFSKFEDEQEVLILPYSPFRVAKRTIRDLPDVNKQRLELELEEYSPEETNIP